MGVNISKMFDNLDLISKEKNISQDKIVDILKYSLEKAYLKDNPDINVLATIDIKNKIINLAEVRIVVDKPEDEIDDDKEINLDEAIKVNKNIKINDEFKTIISLDDFERRNAIHVLQIFQQKLNEESNYKIFYLWKDKINSLIRAEIEKNENNRYVEVNLDSTMGIVGKNDQIPNENLIPGNKYVFLIRDVKEQTKSWPVILSRTSPKLIELLLKHLTPEIDSGIIEIKSVARVAGYKTKIAVKSNNPNIEAVGTCVGVNGERVKNISSLVNNEKIDIFLYDDNPKQMIVNMCYPEKIIGIEITDDPTEDNPNGKIVTIVCKDEDLSRVIGKNGINVKLMSMLTKWSVDVLPLSMAIEDKIEYEDISNLSPVKNVKNSSFTNVTNKKQNNKWFNNKRSSGTKYDDDYESFNFNQLNNNWDFDVTDEEVENLLKLSSRSTKKKKKEVYEEEIVVFNKEKNNESVLSNENDVVNNLKKSEVEKLTTSVETKNNDIVSNNNVDKPITPTPSKPRVSIDEFFDAMEDEKEKAKKNKKTGNKNKGFNNRKSPEFNESKKNKKKIDILDEFDISEDDYDDSSNIDLDDIDYDEF